MGREIKETSGLAAVKRNEKLPGNEPGAGQNVDSGKKKGVRAAHQSYGQLLEAKGRDRRAPRGMEEIGMRGEFPLSSREGQPQGHVHPIGRETQGIFAFPYGLGSISKTTAGIRNKRKFASSKACRLEE